jgi:hypothetical protein
MGIGGGGVVEEATSDPINIKKKKIYIYIQIF